MAKYQAMHNLPEHHIELKTPVALPAGQAGRWAATVIKSGPNGIAVATDILRGRELINTRFYGIKGSSGHHYVVPLARDLTDTEAARIAQRWSESYPDGDFVINWSQRDGMQTTMNRVKVDAKDSIIETAAKMHHTQWYDDLMGAGWTWSPKFSQTQKMHPNLRPWHELPEKIKSRERDKFAKLLGVLEALDLHVTHR